MDCCIVIPAYKPTEEMLRYMDRLQDARPARILVVDDGSGLDYRPVFDALAPIKNCVVLRHDVNRGKGSAIKTALAYHLQYPLEVCLGVITVDCDGQHSVPDVEKIYAELQQQEGYLVLGSRDFGEGTPRRSATGNKVTSKVMSFMYGIQLEDTQTGLRGLPEAILPELVQLSGKRYEYELNMLIFAKRKCIPFALVPIETIYFDNNNGSHYRTVVDSLRIVGQLMKGLGGFFFNAVLSSGVDILIYTLFVKVVFIGLPVAQRLFFSAVISRLSSSLVNYSVNRRLPYVQTRKIYPTMLKYYMVWSLQVVLSFTGVYFLHTRLGLDEVLAKILMDMLLGIANYQAQMRWVFSSKEEQPVAEQQEQEG